MNEKKRAVTLFASLALIIILGFAIYSNSVKGSFIWDDNLLIRNNTYLRNWSNISKLFSHDIRVSRGGLSKFYRPLQMVTYMADYSIWKLDTRGYHLTNIILHILVAICVFWLINLLFGDLLLSLFAGILFAVHPVHTEAVSYISGRADLLVSLFLLISIISYVKYISSERPIFSLSMGASFVCALLSRENALILPVLLVFYHYLFRIKIDLKKFLPIIIIPSAYILLRLTLLKPLLPEASTGPAIFQRIPGFLAAITNYVRLLFVPVGLHMEYGKKAFTFTDPKVILGLAVLISALTYAIRKRDSNRLILFSVGWFLIALLPQSNLYLINAYMAEHWLYLPSVGFFLLLAGVLNSVWKTRAYGYVSVIIIIGLVAYYSTSTIRQNRYWNNPLVFTERTVRLAPDSAKARNYYGNVLDKLGRKEEAMAAYKKAVELDPIYAEAHTNLGILYNEFGRTEEALKFHKKAISIKPAFAEPYNNSGIIYFRLGKHEEAISSYKRAVEIKPDFAIVYNNMAVAYGKLGKTEEAVALYKKAMEIDSKCTEAYFNLGSLYGSLDRHKEAIAPLKRAIETNPDLAVAYNNLATAYYYEGEYALAIKYCDRAKRLGYPVATQFLDLLKPHRK
jgi:pentatricopeptide repeat protein